MIFRLVDRLSPQSVAILLMVLSMALFSAMNALISDAAPTVPTPQMVFLRNAFGLLLMSCVCLPRGSGFFRTRKLREHITRSVVGIVSMELWFYGISLMPVTQATALSFTNPIFTTLLAMLFLGEKVGVRRWCAIAAGLLGALIIVRPGYLPMGYASCVVLLASAMMASVGLFVKTLPRSEHATLIVFYTTLFMTLFCAPLALYVWRPLHSAEWQLMLAIGLLGVLAQWSLAHALARAEMSVLMPFDYTRLIFTAAIAYVWLGETLDLYTLLGAAIIAGSTFYIVHREAQLRKRRAREDANPANS